MAILTVITIPHPTLRKKAKPVDIFDNLLAELAQNMVETMYHKEGIGLAANQVNVLKRLIVADCSQERDDPIVFVNPTFKPLSDEIEECEEGCLSIPGVQAGPINRYLHIEVSAQDIHGNPFTVEASDLFARCIQHEIDHLDGQLYIDYLSPLKRDRLVAKMQKLQKEKEADQKD